MKAVHSGQPGAGTVTEKSEGATEAGMLGVRVGTKEDKRLLCDLSVGHRHPQPFLSPVAVSKHPNPD